PHLTEGVLRVGGVDAVEGGRHHARPLLLVIRGEEEWDSGKTTSPTLLPEKGVPLLDGQQKDFWVGPLAFPFGNAVVLEADPGVSRNQAVARGVIPPLPPDLPAFQPPAHCTRGTPQVLCDVCYVPLFCQVHPGDLLTPVAEIHAG